MNAVTLFLALVLYGNPTCQTSADRHTSVDGQMYALQTYDCFWGEAEEVSRSFEVWSPVCHHYVDQPIVISERHAKRGWIMNRFGEFHAATGEVEPHRNHSTCETQERTSSQTGKPEADQGPLSRLRAVLQQSAAGQPR